MDPLTAEQRHRCMASIRSKNTKTEVLVRKFLFSRGFFLRFASKAAKPSVDTDSFTLNHIFLQDRTLKRYEVAEDEMMMAADNETEYNTNE